MTPNLGGVAFYISLMLVFLVSGYATPVWVAYFLAGITLIFFSGIKDDIIVLSARKKLFFQVAAVAFLIFGGNIVITDLGGVFGIETISYGAGVALTAFTMIVVINAYNLIDGIDGLAGTIGFLICLFFGGWFWSIGNMPYAVLSFVGAGTLLGFLWFNMQPASIFMGDTGSQVIGYLLAFLSVSFVKVGQASTAYVPFENEIPILVVAVLIVPLYDTLRVFTLRAFKNGSPFKPDRLHIHHQLQDIGFSDRVACYVIALLNLSIMSIVFLMGGMNINIIFVTVFVSALLLFPTRGLKRSILEKLNIELPSSRKIYYWELKYGFNNESVRRKEMSRSEEESEEEEWEQIAV